MSKINLLLLLYCRGFPAIEWADIQAMKNWVPRDQKVVSPFILNQVFGGRP